ncbi:MAG: TIGR02147 family protein [Deltaproteobacteria bacterium]|nr:TIGR02147 family protein [Deltaproteobacteria bacterium]
MKKVFQYLDYREFLKERFAYLKKHKRNVTHRALSTKAGFTSPNFLKLVMDGKRNLTEDSLCKVCKAFDLNEKECAFFKALVNFNQAKDFQSKEEAYQKLRQTRQDLPLQHLDHAQMEYLEAWHHVALREMVELKDFKEDPFWIQEKLGKEIKISDIKKSLALLETLGLLERNAEGKLRAKQRAISTGNEVASLAAFRFHQGMIEKAKEALQKTSAEERDISSLTLALSEEKFLEVKKRLQDFRKEILSLVQDEQAASTVYQLNFQLFNLTECVWHQNKEKN